MVTFSVNSGFIYLLVFSWMSSLAFTNANVPKKQSWWMWIKLIGSKSYTRTSPHGNIFPVTGSLWGESTGQRWIPSQRPVMQSIDVFFDQCLNLWLGKQSIRWWLETPSRPLWCHCNQLTTKELKMDRWFSGCAAPVYRATTRKHSFSNTCIPHNGSFVISPTHTHTPNSNCSWYIWYS